ncbi:MAG: LysR family transcriptional regulator [Oscillospiraceae bacterium]
MNTLHFKYAVEVEKTGSISQAAENLFMAQPNLSKAIKELEDTLGISIFERTSKGVVATEQGREFLEYAKQILVQLGKMESIYVTPDEKFNRQSIKLSMPRSSYISIGLSNFIKELDLAKEIDIHIQETNSLKAIDNVSGENFSLGIIRYQRIFEKYFTDYLKEKNLEHETVWEFERLVLMSTKHAMANLPSIDYRDLAGSSIEIVHDDNSIPYLVLPEVKKPWLDEGTGGKTKRIYVYERGSQFDLLSHVHSTYMWVSPIPEELINRNSLIQRRCEVANNCFKDVLIYRKGYKLTDIEKKLINKIYEEKNEVFFANYK